MAELRWWAEKIGKQSVMARDNDRYGIGTRNYVTQVSKARDLCAAELVKVTDPYMAMSLLRLQVAFGLRRAESIKIQPTWADRGNQLVLKASWAKGGRAREIPTRNDVQRRELDAAKALAGKGSLVTADRTYVEQPRRFEHQWATAGIHRVHGHRHQYAQVRYRELTGWAAPAAGGPRSKDLTPEQREVDRDARLTISEEHGTWERTNLRDLHFPIAVGQPCRLAMPQRNWRHAAINAPRQAGSRKEYSVHRAGS